MQLLEVGKLFKEGATRYQEGCRVDVDDTGINLFLYYNNPTEEEVKDTKGGNFKFGFYKENNAIFMLFKCGDQEWIDSPYSAHLSKNLTKLELADEGKGLALHVYLIDAGTGILKVMRLIGLKTKISQDLIEAIKCQQLMDFKGYDSNIRNVYNKYSTKDLVSMSKIMY